MRLDTGELVRIRSAMARPRFSAASEVSARFAVSTEDVRRLLPPGLEPAADPALLVRVGRFTSNLFGAYQSGGVQVTARHGDREGRYVLALYCDSASAVAYGRDFFGEPKKQATISYSRIDNRVDGVVLRDGVELIRISGEVRERTVPPVASVVTFNYQAHLRWDNPAAGSVALTSTTLEVVHGIGREVRGAAWLGSTRNDPLAAQAETVGAPELILFEGDLEARMDVLQEIDPAAYVAYAFGRYDDWSGGTD